MYGNIMCYLSCEVNSYVTSFFFFLIKKNQLKIWLLCPNMKPPSLNLLRTWTLSLSSCRSSVTASPSSSLNHHLHAISASSFSRIICKPLLFYLYELYTEDYLTCKSCLYLLKLLDNLDY